LMDNPAQITIVQKEKVSVHKNTLV
jgi:hypothetical protein